MAYRQVNELIMENARIMFRNFSGREERFNRAGDRNFCVPIQDVEQAEMLKADGWNIKTLKPREEGEEPLHYLQVAVRFDNVPPKAFMVTRKKKTQLTQETIGLLDNADIKSVDMTITPYCWEANGSSGVKAYLKTLYAVIEEDAFAHKYDDLDDDYEREVPFQ